MKWTMVVGGPVVAFPMGSALGRAVRVPADNRYTRRAVEMPRHQACAIFHCCRFRSDSKHAHIFPEPMTSLFLSGAAKKVVLMVNKAVNQSADSNACGYAFIVCELPTSGI